MPYIDLNKIRTENHWTNRVKDKAREVGRNVLVKAKEGVEFVKENPEAAGILLTAVGLATGGVKKITHAISKEHQLNKERYNKERYIYDHSTNMYLKLKRPLKEADVRNIDALRSKGYSKIKALAKLNLLER